MYVRDIKARLFGSHGARLIAGGHPSPVELFYRLEQQTAVNKRRYDAMLEASPYPVLAVVHNFQFLEAVQPGDLLMYLRRAGISHAIQPTEVRTTLVLTPDELAAIEVDALRALCPPRPKARLSQQSLAKHDLFVGAFPQDQLFTLYLGTSPLAQK